MSGVGPLHYRPGVIDKIKEAAAPYADDLVQIGHSVGGLIVQKLIAERIGKPGVAICSVAPNRMLSLDWGFFKNSAAITNPLTGDGWLVEKNAKAFKDKESQVSYREFANRSHFICGEPAWEEVATYIADWIEVHSTIRAGLAQRRVS